MLRHGATGVAVLEDGGVGTRVVRGLICSLHVLDKEARSFVHREREGGGGG